jgi:hypothetical protein
MTGDLLSRKRRGNNRKWSRIWIVMLAGKRTGNQARNFFFLVLCSFHKHQIFTSIFKLLSNLLLEKGGLGTLFSAYLVLAK